MNLANNITSSQGLVASNHHLTSDKLYFRYKIRRYNAPKLPARWSYFVVSLSILFFWGMVHGDKKRPDTLDLEYRLLQCEGHAKIESKLKSIKLISNCLYEQ